MMPMLTACHSTPLSTPSHPTPLMQDLVHMFTSMAQPGPMGDDADADDDDRLPLYCAFNFPAVVVGLGPSRWWELEAAYAHLLASPHLAVRRTLACHVHELAGLLGPAITVRCLLPALEALVCDEDEVRMALVPTFTAFMACLPASHRPHCARLLPRLLWRQGLTPEDPSVDGDEYVDSPRYPPPPRVPVGGAADAGVEGGSNTCDSNESEANSCGSNESEGNICDNKGGEGRQGGQCGEGEEAREEVREEAKGEVREEAKGEVREESGGLWAKIVSGLGGLGTGGWLGEVAFGAGVEGKGGEVASGAGVDGGGGEVGRECVGRSVEVSEGHSGGDSSSGGSESSSTSGNGVVQGSESNGDSLSEESARGNKEGGTEGEGVAEGAKRAEGTEGAEETEAERKVQVGTPAPNTVRVHVAAADSPRPLVLGGSNPSVQVQLRALPSRNRVRPQMRVAGRESSWHLRLAALSQASGVAQLLPPNSAALPLLIDLVLSLCRDRIATVREEAARQAAKLLTLTTLSAATSASLQAATSASSAPAMSACHSSLTCEPTLPATSARQGWAGHSERVDSCASAACNPAEPLSAEPHSTASCCTEPLAAELYAAEPHGGSGNSSSTVHGEGEARGGDGASNRGESNGGESSGGGKRGDGESEGSSEREGEEKGVHEHDMLHEKGVHGSRHGHQSNPQDASHATHSTNMVAVNLVHPHPASHPGAHPASHPGAHPASHPGAHPASHPGAHPASHPGAHRASHPGAHPSPAVSPPPDSHASASEALLAALAGLASSRNFRDRQTYFVLAPARPSSLLRASALIFLSPLPAHLVSSFHHSCSSPQVIASP
ncbi:unnamed protein product [Closterium sp. Yama58-4]|nr:unnamed protein product [Closterium sp. Yama58-4]